MYWLGIVIFIVGLLISVALHELGHMIPAKAFGPAFGWVCAYGRYAAAS